jgi:hypothetical protein
MAPGGAIGTAGKKSAEPKAKPYNNTKPNWMPLGDLFAATLGPEFVDWGCEQFMWMREEPQGTHQYKHRDSRKYVHLRENEQPVQATVDMLTAALGIPRLVLSTVVHHG